MKVKFLDSEEAYTGAQLVSLQNYLRHHLLGDSVVSWIGPCHVDLDHMVDGEDWIAGAQICGDRMLHFIVEMFDSTLFAAVAVQRLLTSIMKDEIVARSPERELSARMVRVGDDLFVEDRKLSISIATQSPVSSLIHFAVNVTNAGTPVPTLSLTDLRLDPKAVALAVMATFATEMTGVREATHKVRWVK